MPLNQNEIKLISDISKIRPGGLKMNVSVWFHELVKRELKLKRTYFSQEQNYARKLIKKILEGKIV